MKSILISIQSQWVNKIINRKKTIEIRNTRPKCELPCKVYIYCTKGKLDKDNLVVSHSLPAIMPYNANGKVVAEFTLNKIIKHKKNYLDYDDVEDYCFKVSDVKDIGFDTDVMSLLDFGQFLESYGQGKPLYAWHIDNLKIYDKPKELIDFKYSDCEFCKHIRIDSYDTDNRCCWAECHNILKKPPQSWCYVEEVDNG